MGMVSRPGNHSLEFRDVVLNGNDLDQLGFDNRYVSHIGIVTSAAGLSGYASLPFSMV